MRNGPSFDSESYVERLLHGRPRQTAITAPPGVTIAGEHPLDPTYLRIVFDDGLEAALPKTATHLLPRMVEIHDDVRRQCAEQGVPLTTAVQ